MDGGAPSNFPQGYHCQRRLGAGRSAQAFLAEHSEWGEVVVKLPRSDQGDTVLRRMFENEVHITLALRHPNVVRAYEGVATGPAAFLAMEYCPGGTLESAARESVPLPRRRQLIVQVAQALEHVHGRGFLHRDIKPANVLLASDGSVRLADFGSGVHHAAARSERVGTPYYMAPEIFEGEPASFRSDVYSLAVLAYELLAGERPFKGGSYDELMVAHRTGMPRSLTHANTAVGRGEARAIAAAMSPLPARRTATVREFREAFETALSRETSLMEPPVPSPEVGRASRRGVYEPDAAPSRERGRKSLWQRLLRSLRGGRS